MKRVIYHFFDQYNVLVGRRDVSDWTPADCDRLAAACERRGLKFHVRVTDIDTPQFFGGGMGVKP